MNWWSMGGYGQYVWPSYALMIITVLLNIYWARRSQSQARAEARRRLAMQQEQP
jgi:heme exporter protein D